MSDRVTRCSPRATNAERPIVYGLTVYGRKSREDAIQSFRAHYEQQRAQAERALALTDDELIVHTYLGVHAHRKFEEVTS